MYRRPANCCATDCILPSDIRALMPARIIRNWKESKKSGPIPAGKYFIGTPHDTLTHGPFVLPLTPDPANEMFGRSAFLMHGDSVVDPGTASRGCIIMSRAVRKQVAASGDAELRVISGGADDARVGLRAHGP
jgi:hypothetical protein